jgi:ubiquinone/menaquinone biosynthesis C-methylase UbiE
MGNIVKDEPDSTDQGRWGKFANSYVSSESHAKGYDLERLVNLGKPQPDWLVLDIATGGGHTALKFSPTVENIIAVDLTPKMLNAARAFVEGQGITKIIFGCANAEALPFSGSVFDAVTCRIAPHHFNDCGRFIQESARVLKPGGRFLLQDHVLPDDEVAARYIDDFERLRDPGHIRAFSHEEWINLTQNSGLKIETTEEITKRHILRIWAERQGCTPATLTKLVSMIQDAPPIVRDWLQVKNLGTPEASFVNHHIILSGRKPS